MKVCLQLQSGSTVSSDSNERLSLVRVVPRIIDFDVVNYYQLILIENDILAINDHFHIFHIRNSSVRASLLVLHYNLEVWYRVSMVAGLCEHIWTSAHVVEVEPVTSGIMRVS